MLPRYIGGGIVRFRVGVVLGTKFRLEYVQELFTLRVNLVEQWYAGDFGDWGAEIFLSILPRQKARKKYRSTTLLPTIALMKIVLVVQGAGWTRFSALGSLWCRLDNKKEWRQGRQQTGKCECHNYVDARENAPRGCCQTSVITTLHLSLSTERAWGVWPHFPEIYENISVNLDQIAINLVMIFSCYGTRTVLGTHIKYPNDEDRCFRTVQLPSRSPGLSLGERNTSILASIA